MYYNEVLKLNRNERVNIGSPIIRKFVYGFLVKRGVKNRTGVLLLNYKTEKEFSNAIGFKFLVVSNNDPNKVYFPFEISDGREIKFLDWLERHGLVEEFKSNSIEKSKVSKMHKDVKLNKLEFVETRNTDGKLFIVNLLEQKKVKLDSGFVFFEKQTKLLSRDTIRLAVNSEGEVWHPGSGADTKNYKRISFKKWISRFTYEEVEGLENSRLPNIAPILKILYLENHNNCGLKVGDKVRITRSAKTYENGWQNSWVPGMNNYVGTKSTITIDESESGFYLGGYSFPHFVLEKVDDKSSSDIEEEASEFTSEEKEKLIKEAKKRYPIGSKVLPPHVDHRNENEYFIVRAHNFEFVSGSLYAPTKMGLQWVPTSASDFVYYGNTTYNRVLFHKTRWAKVIGHVDENVSTSGENSSSVTQPINDSKPVEKLHIDTDNVKIGTENSEQSSEVECDFKVGDRVTLRRGLIDYKSYGQTVFFPALRTSFDRKPVQTITSITDNGNYRTSDSGYIYSPEMLELVEKLISEKDYSLTLEEQCQLKPLSEIPGVKIKPMPSLFVTDSLAIEDEPVEKSVHPMLKKIELKKIKY